MSRTTAMHDGRVDFEQLQRLSGLTTQDAVARWLKLDGVTYALDGRALPWTTLAAIRRSHRRVRGGGTTYPCADLALEMRA